MVRGLKITRIMAGDESNTITRDGVLYKLTDTEMGNLSKIGMQVASYLDFQGQGQIEGGRMEEWIPGSQGLRLDCFLKQQKGIFYQSKDFKMNS